MKYETAQILLELTQLYISSSLLLSCHSQPVIIHRCLSFCLVMPKFILGYIRGSFLCLVSCVVAILIARMENFVVRMEWLVLFFYVHIYSIVDVLCVCICKCEYDTFICDLFNNSILSASLQCIYC